MLDIEGEAHVRGEMLLVVRGELDYATADRLRQAVSAVLNHGGVDVIALDLRELTFIDSTGIGTLVVARRICDAVGVRLRLIAVSAFVARLLGVVGMAETMGVPRPATVAGEEPVAATPGR